MLIESTVAIKILDKCLGVIMALHYRDIAALTPPLIFILLFSVMAAIISLLSINFLLHNLFLALKVALLWR
jgi:hypothetical protein